MSLSSSIRVGIGGPVGSGKTALLEALCRALGKEYSIAVVTNDIYTREDAEFLIRRGVLDAARIIGVETGGCPHTAIREDASLNIVRHYVADLYSQIFRCLNKNLLVGMCHENKPPT